MIEQDEDSKPLLEAVAKARMSADEIAQRNKADAIRAMSADEIAQHQYKMGRLNDMSQDPTPLIQAMLDAHMRELFRQNEREEEQ